MKEMIAWVLSDSVLLSVAACILIPLTALMVLITVLIVDNYVSTWSVDKLIRKIRKGSEDVIPESVRVKKEDVIGMANAVQINSFLGVEDVIDHCYVVYAQKTDERGKFGQVWHIDEIVDGQVVESAIQTKDNKSEAVKVARKMSKEGDVDTILVQNVDRDGIDFSRSKGLN